MMWVWREQWRSQLTGMFWGVAWMLALALMPAMIGRAIDQGLVQRSTSGLLTWAGVVMGLGVFTGVAGGMRHRSALTNWLSAAYITIQATSRHSVRVGADLPRLIASGDVLAIGTTDVESLGNSFDIWARLSGGIVSTIVVAIIMLTTSVPLGLVVLIGVPVMMACTVVLLRPLRRRQDAYRELQGDLSDQTVDIAQGIRILRGIGGEDAFSARYTSGSQRLRGIGIGAARIESMLAAQEVLLPGLLTALVTWLAAHFALHGEITLGQLVAFYGYAAFLSLPLSFFGEAADEITRGHVAAERVVKLLRLTSPIKEPESPAPPPPNGAELADPASGLTIPPGSFLAVACSEPEDAENLATRLARYVDVDVNANADEDVHADGDEGVLPDVGVHVGTGVNVGAGVHMDGIDGNAGRDDDKQQPRPTLGGVPLSDLSVDVVRKRILLAANGDRIFAGTLRQSLCGTTTASDELVLDALHAASAEDIVDALDQGLDTKVEEKGRNFSGGQLQRLRLARALIADPEILLAVEATSAVDAHTEARIAERIGAYRAHREAEGTSGTRTTVLFTTSPLVLDHADVVAYVEDGQVVATGKHGDLLAKQRGYRALVTRGEDESDSESEAEGEGEGEGDESECQADIAATDVDANDGGDAAHAGHSAAADASAATALLDVESENALAVDTQAADSTADTSRADAQGDARAANASATVAQGGVRTVDGSAAGVGDGGAVGVPVARARGDDSAADASTARALSDGGAAGAQTVGVLGDVGVMDGSAAGAPGGGDLAEDAGGVLSDGGLAEDVGGVLSDGGLAEDVGGVLSDGGLAEDVGGVLGDGGSAGDVGGVLGDGGLAGEVGAGGGDNDLGLDLDVDVDVGADGDSADASVREAREGAWRS
jgi:ABC-type multidrug transport system fused ATPase/permease subunit